MIVQCGQCSTKFKLDDAKVKDSGVKVRCSKCRHVFTVFPEAPSEEVSFDAILDGFGPGKPESHPTPDAGVTLPENVPPAKAESPQPLQSDDVPGWDPEVFSPELSATGAGAKAPDFGFAEETAFAAQAGVTLPEPAAPQDDEDVFRSDVPVASPSLPVENSASFDESTFPEWNIPVSEPEVSSRDELEPAGPYDSDGSFNSPEDQPGTEAGPAVGATSAAREPVSVDSSPPDESSESTTPAESDGAGASPQVVAPTPPVVPEDDELPPLSIASRRRGHTIFPIVVTAISIVFVLALAAGGFFFLKEGPQGLEKMGLGSLSKWAGIEAVDEGSISVRATSGTFIANKEAGELLVIRGEAVNGYRKPRAAVQVRGVVFGQKGEVLVRKTAYCGNSLTNEQLATLPLTKIEAAMNNQFGDSLSNLGVQPGKAIPFVLVLSQVPKNATDFGVEVVGSTVATQ